MFVLKYPAKRFSSNRSSRPKVFCKKGVLRNFLKFTGKHLCQNLFFNKVVILILINFIKNQTLAQVFSCEFCEISKNAFFYRTPPGDYFQLCSSLGFSPAQFAKFGDQTPSKCDENEVSSTLIRNFEFFIIYNQKERPV